MINDIGGACAKQVTVAIIVTKDGVFEIGTNECLTPVKVCPRQGMPSGVGYDLCKSVCNQTGHAEVNAIKKVSTVDTRGATMFLLGHNYICADCQKAIDDAGIQTVIIVDDLLIKKQEK